MTVEHLDSFDFDPEAEHDLGSCDDLELDLDLVPIVDLEDVQIDSIDQLVESLEEDNSEDDQKMEEGISVLYKHDFQKSLILCH